MEKNNTKENEKNPTLSNSKKHKHHKRHHHHHRKHKHHDNYDSHKKKVPPYAAGLFYLDSKPNLSGRCPSRR